MATTPTKDLSQIAVDQDVLKQMGTDATLGRYTHPWILVLLATIALLVIGFSLWIRAVQKEISDAEHANAILIEQFKTNLAEATVDQRASFEEIGLSLKSLDTGLKEIAKVQRRMRDVEVQLQQIHDALDASKDVDTKHQQQIDQTVASVESDLENIRSSIAKHQQSNATRTIDLLQKIGVINAELAKLKLLRTTTVDPAEQEQLPQLSPSTPTEIKHD